jgi:hypothetical protein
MQCCVDIESRECPRMQCKFTVRESDPGLDAPMAVVGYSQQQHPDIRQKSEVTQSIRFNLGLEAHEPT